MLTLLLQLATTSPMTWEPEHTALTVAATSLIAADCVQTYHTAVRHPDRYVERNPLLGSHPTAERLAILCGAAIVANGVIAWSIPEKPRRWFLRAVVAVEAVVVISHALRH